MAKKFKFHFNGRETGAQGITSDRTVTYEAKEMGEALFMLHTDYEHVRVWNAHRGKEKLPIPGAINVPVIDNSYKGKHPLK